MKFTRKKPQRQAQPIAILSMAAGLCFLFVIVFLVGKKDKPAEKAMAQITKKNPVPENSPAAPGVGKASLEMDVPTLVKSVSGSVVSIITFDGRGNRVAEGSGFVYRDPQYILTNRHIFQGAERAEVKTRSGTFKVTKFLAEDTDHDLLLLKMENPDSRLIPIPIQTAIPTGGEKIVVIGNPLGLETTISDGIVAAVREMDQFGRVIQITAPISPGSSGSPVLNLRGEVVGVATFQLQQGQNLNFAIPVEHAQKLKAEGDKTFAQMDARFHDEFIALKTPMERGKYLFERKLYDEASAHFEKAVGENYSSASAHYHLGVCLKEADPARAVRELKIAIDLDAQNPEAFFHLGELYLQMNNQDEAILAFEEALRLNPEHAESLKGVAGLYLLKERFKQAIRTLEKARYVKPDPQVDYVLGMSYAAVDRHLEAIDTFQRSIRLDPDKVEPYIGLGYVFVKVKNWKLGIRTINEGIMRNPRNAELHLILGVLHLGNDDVFSAEVEVERLNELKSNEYRSKLKEAISRYQYAKSIR